MVIHEYGGAATAGGLRRCGRVTATAQSIEIREIQPSDAR